MTRFATTPPTTIPRPDPRQRHQAGDEDLRQHALRRDDGGAAEFSSRRRHPASASRSTRSPTSPPTTRPDTGETRLTVTIADDGSGIADPAVLLSFGENGWSDDLVRREDAAGSVSPACRAAAAPCPRGPVRPTATPSPDGASISRRSISWARPTPKSAPMTAHRSPMARRSRSRRPRPPPRSATPPRRPPGITRCPCFSRASLAPSPVGNSSNAAPFSTVRSMPSPGAASPSASSRTAIAATTTPISTSSA